jgi:N-acetylneuraminic acid mutarotase
MAPAMAPARVSGSTTTLPANPTATVAPRVVPGRSVLPAPGAPVAGIVPGARERSVSWIDGLGNLWVFGGYGYDSSGTTGYLNDLWRYEPVSGQWTWTSGASLVNQVGSYGTLGTPDATNVPGGRYGSVSWVDGFGRLWLFGGYGYDSVGSVGYLNDLWQYDPINGQWTWVSGADTVNQEGGYAHEPPEASSLPGGGYEGVSRLSGYGKLESSPAAELLLPDGLEPARPRQ